MHSSSNKNQKKSNFKLSIIEEQDNEEFLRRSKILDQTFQEGGKEKDQEKCLKDELLRVSLESEEKMIEKCNFQEQIDIRFLLKSTIGKGSFGTVYRGYDRILGK